MTTSQVPMATPVGAPGERDVGTPQRPSGRSGGGWHRLARGLGCFSLALGTAQLVAPGRVNRLAGFRDGDRTRALQRLVGGRELLAGAGLLSPMRPAGWLWARVAGDAADVALAGAAVRTGHARRGRGAAVVAALAGVAAVDLLAARRHGRATRPTKERGPVRVRTAITVNKPVEEVYRFWRRLENLPRFTAHLESVSVSDDGRSHWVARGPAGTSVEWDAEIVEDRRDEVIAWRSSEGAVVPNRGSVRFTSAPAGQGTEVLVDLEYEAPGRRAAAVVAKLFGEEPAQQARDDLRRLKQVLETGEVVRSEGSPEGTRVQRQWRQHEGQPAA